MTVQKRKDGSYYISDIVKGYLVWEVYYYCTKREAIRYFKQKVKGESGDAFRVLQTY